ncbi:MAG TPA: cupin domain-containing protein [Candidatus Limnocylindrales bacterium]|nr:cupin domain-containing protein [Candidatus Limnocylindrales bacterium]
MAPLAMRAGVVDGAAFERHELFGDEVLLRVVDAGDVEVIEYRSEDRDGPPAHAHPWDEIEYVIEGAVDFLVGETWTRAPAGSVQMLPRGVPHSVRVPSGSARLLFVTIGAPYAGFAREVSALGAAGYPAVDRLLEIARRHGLQPAATLT